MSTVLIIYAITSAFCFVLWLPNETLGTRAVVSAIAPLLLVFAGVKWVVERLEELG